MRDNKTIILKTYKPMSDSGIKELEEEYSEKLGCNVVVLNAYMELVDEIR